MLFILDNSGTRAVAPGQQRIRRPARSSCELILWNIMICMLYIMKWLLKKKVKHSFIIPFIWFIWFIYLFIYYSISILWIWKRW